MRDKLIRDEALCFSLSLFLSSLFLKLGYILARKEEENDAHLSPVSNNCLTNLINNNLIKSLRSIPERFSFTFVN